MASLCRGHITTEICQKCIASASIDVAQRCPTGYEAVIWYGQYMVHYSNRSIYSVMTTGPKEDLMISRDVLERVTQKFATKEVKFNEFQDVCRLAQCTPDISGDECNRCLQFAIGGLPECCSGKEAGFALYPSCILRYQITPFITKPKLQHRRLGSYSTSCKSSISRSGKGQINPVPLSALLFQEFVPRVIFSIGLYWILIWKARKKKTRQLNKDNGICWKQNGGPILQFDFCIIEDPTNNFAHANMIGAGAFGGLYKGVIANGQEIAVKRLSRSSGQGGEEFKIEVVLLAKLQHQNLVRLLGF
ncbi:hypothetical protein SLEP1_g29558 [Rubroshorea leprosula]|uniref:Uncharacterized protein n=1 Tax=Rubroshorea leprosula TaxID=152421 RepID=A0AAV5K3D6_9ROSI|nr:hypothetical protein SLEP1_g29558 [Rubroshorea leprosula]